MSSDLSSLDRLHDIVAPAPAPFWPPAPGWIVLGVLAFFLGFLFAARGLRSYQRNHYRREALAALAARRPLLRDAARRAEGVAAVAVVLKRAALTAWPRERVAALTGSDWLAFLDRSGRLSGFADGPGRHLETALYDPAAAARLDDTETEKLAALARRWIARHRAEEEDAAC